MSELPLRILPNGILGISSLANSTKSQLVYYAKGSISKYMLTQTPDSEETYFVSIYEKGVVSSFSYQFRSSKELLPEVHEILQTFMSEENEEEEGEEGEEGEEEEEQEKEQQKEQEKAENYENEPLLDIPTLLAFLSTINILCVFMKLTNFFPMN